MPEQLSKKVSVHDDLVGHTVLGKFEIVQILSTGGSGTVYMANQLSLGRMVALKVLNNELSGDEQGVRRFRREAKAARNFSSHPGLATVYECGFLEDNRPFISMQLAAGEPFSSMLENAGPLPAERALPLFLQIADALSFAHSNEVLHRDITPSNIMLTEDSEGQLHTRVVDFGLARPTGTWALKTDQLTRFGNALGNPPYMSPEQCSGKDLDERSDIYSMGCMMYEVITGKPPLVGRSTLDTMQKHFSEVPAIAVVEAVSEPVGSALAHVVASCLEKKPSVRYGSMDELKEALARACDGVFVAPVQQNEMDYAVKAEGAEEDSPPTAATAPSAPGKADPAMEVAYKQGQSRIDLPVIMSAAGKLVTDSVVHRLLLILLSCVVVVYSLITMGPQLPAVLQIFTGTPAPKYSGSVNLLRGDEAVSYNVKRFDPMQLNLSGSVLHRENSLLHLDTMKGGALSKRVEAPAGAKSFCISPADDEYYAVGDDVVLRAASTGDTSVVFKQKGLSSVRWDASRNGLIISFTTGEMEARPGVPRLFVCGLNKERQVSYQYLLRVKGDSSASPSKFAIGPANDLWTWTSTADRTEIFSIDRDQAVVQTWPHSKLPSMAKRRYVIPASCNEMFFSNNCIWLVTAQHEIWRLHTNEPVVDVFSLPESLNIVDGQI